MMKKNNINKIGYSNIEIARFEGSMIVRNYHEDWNELMRVVKKIKELKINDFYIFWCCSNTIVST